MGIKEQTVSVHIRGSYRYRRAPYNRNRRSKRARFGFLPSLCFLSFISFSFACRCKLAYREQEVITYVLANYVCIMRNHAAGRDERKDRKEEICVQLAESFAAIFSRSLLALAKNGSGSVPIKQQYLARMSKMTFV